MNGEDVKRLREVFGLTQEELAQKIGVSRNTIVNYERGSVIPESRRQLLLSLFELSDLDAARTEDIQIENDNIVGPSSNKGNMNREATIPAQELHEIIRIPREVWDVIRDQAASLKVKDRQMDEVIGLLKDQIKKGEDVGEQGHAAPQAAQG